MLRLARAIETVDRFVRLHLWGFTAVWPLLGGVSVQPDPSWREVFLLLAVSLPFHVYSCVLNDLMDVGFDRANPARSHRPLVTGAIGRGTAWAVVLVQLPICLWLASFLEGGLLGSGCLVAAFLALTVYDLWGKRCPVPPLTDVVQGLSGPALAVWGALAVGSSPQPLTWMVGAYAVVFVLQTNGLHFGLRDLGPDLATGARTTASFLGARPREDGTIAVPGAVYVFGFGVYVILVSLPLVAIARNDFHYPFSLQRGMLAGYTVAAILGLALLRRALQVNREGWDFWYRAHLFLILLAVLVPFVPYASPRVGALLLALCFGPLLALRTVRRAAAWLLRSLFRREAAGPA